MKVNTEPFVCYSRYEHILVVERDSKHFFERQLFKGVYSNCSESTLQLKSEGEMCEFL